MENRTGSVILGKSGTRPAWRLKRLAAGIVVALAGLLYWNDVPTDLTDDDRRYAALILRDARQGADSGEAAKPDDFEGEVRVILAVQDAVLKTAPTDKGIPLGEEREPEDLYERKYGLCFDRSRAIEKILTWIGFETRHVAIYGTSSFFEAFLVPQIPSHAVTEALTKKGWMLIDSNARWIGLDAQRNPVSIDRIQDGLDDIGGWAPENRDPMNAIFNASFIQVRGLYSRHGYFYPPFIPVPDLNLRQILSNVL